MGESFKVTGVMFPSHHMTTLWICLDQSTKYVIYSSTTINLFKLILFLHFDI